MWDAVAPIAAKPGFGSSLDMGDVGDVGGRRCVGREPRGPLCVESRRRDGTNRRGMVVFEPSASMAQMHGIGGLLDSPSQPKVLRRITKIAAPASDLELGADFGGERLFEWDDGGLSFRAVGAVPGFDASDPQTLAALHHRIAGDAADGLPVWVGGRAFDLKPGRAEWRGWPAHRFWLPRRIEVRRGAEQMLIEHMSAEPGSSVGTEPVKAFDDHIDDPAATETRKHWHATVLAALTAIESEAVHKVVLARRQRLALLPSPSAISRRLGVQAGMTRYRVRWDSSGGELVGLTPETLVDLRPGRVMSESLAGTAPQSEAESLLARAKDREEQMWVTRAIQRIVSSHGHHVDVDGPRVATFDRLCHLRTRITAVPERDDGLLEWIERLHPTPAVCGFPRVAAMTWLRHHQPWDRGWYCGALGWFDGVATGRAVVALRCGLLHRDHVHLYAGVGIVPGSDAELEWREIELKMEGMAAALEQDATCRE